MENIPDHNRYVVAFNHVSLVEVPFILAFWPTVLEILGAAAVWERPGQSLLARLYKGIQLKRDEYDRAVFDLSKKIIEAGRPLMISPEGGRSHTPGLRRGKPGVAFIVDQTQIPVLPVAVVGATMDFLSNGLRGKRPFIEMRVGELFQLPPLAGRGEERRRNRQHNADIIMARVAELLPESYRGVYSDFESILNGKHLLVE
jgi:1-acyl-sn-glycerol-3-phosphate acyltransferase